VNRGVSATVGVLSQKFVEELRDRVAVIPAKAGIQKSLKFLDSGSRLLAKAGIPAACPE
jgi:hypothetical protein